MQVLRVWSSIRSMDDLGLFHRIERNINKKKKKIPRRIFLRRSKIQNRFKHFRNQIGKLRAYFQMRGKLGEIFFPPRERNFTKFAAMQQIIVKRENTCTG